MMNFTPLPNSLYDTKSQEDTAKNQSQKGGFSGYFFNILCGKRKFHIFLFGLFLGIVSSIQPAYIVYRYGIPFVKDLDAKVKAIVNEVMPDKLEIKIQNGMASSNVHEPYFLTITQSTLKDFLQLNRDKFGQTPDHQPQAKIRLLTIDTQGKAEDFEKYQSLAMLTARNLVYYRDNEVTIKSLSSVPNIKITKKYIIDNINKINAQNRVVKSLTFFLYLSPVFLTIVFLLSFLLSVLAGAFFAWIMGKIFSLKIAFSGYYHLTAALYALPAFILSVVKYVPYINLFYSWIYTLMNVLVLSAVYVIILKNKEVLIENSHG